MSNAQIGKMAMAVTALRGMIEGLSDYEKPMAYLSGANDYLHDLMIRARKIIPANEMGQMIKLFLPSAEARVRVLNWILQMTIAGGHKSILELASGFSTRGMLFTKDQKIKWVESDVPEMIRKKEQIVSKILTANNEERKNLFFRPVELPDITQLKTAAEMLNGKMIIITEGLLGYCRREEKVKIALDINEVLRLHGGLWVTIDLGTKKEGSIGLGEDQRMKTNRVVQLETSIDIEKYKFEDGWDVMEFLDETKFEIYGNHPFCYQTESLTTLNALRDDYNSYAIAEALLSRHTIHVLKPFTR